ncbi:nucleotidyl transferase AbiEii/AbiGii toxin family protein [Nonlabens sp. MIC269]|uniref:nucleotidyl transferase AbiEii/AbiGii toxin family protein n=1 Tax=Nonlabens sp. MIC269 TaxID=1476901 RepID=UPI000760FB43|nr:nucleotidyl transferase AbiEii/AbiGii toxin family protein [Nonlabens sp. MIC269]
MENKVINLDTVGQVAMALQELKAQMVFIGGAVVSVYTDDPSADEIRPTADIDLTINLLNYSDWAQMQERLAQLGFSPDPNGHAICSYLYEGISVDIMPAEDGPIGPANKWYKIGFQNLYTTEVKGEAISILSAPCYIATKFEAFNDRGTDYRTSHDFEDIIYVMDNRTTIVEEINEDHPEVKEFIKDEFIKIYTSPTFTEVISCHIHPLIMDDRLPILIHKIEKIIKS